MAYWTLYTIGRRIAFSNDSVATAIGSLQNPSAILPSQCYISARVLNRQIKGEMWLIYEEHLGDLLEGLEREYNPKTRTSWAISFCAILILCMIAEELETQFNGNVVYNIFEEGEDPVLAANSGTTCCRELEDVLINYSWTSFFGKDRKNNPFRQGCDDEPSLNPGEAKLLGDFRRIFRDYSN
jgi:hypothetical protein